MLQIPLPLDLAARPGRGPAGTPLRPLVFASGANDVGEIRGFVSVGIPVGVSAGHIHHGSIGELAKLAGTGVPVLLDSGAVHEVSAEPTRQAAAGLAPRPGELLVVKEIPPEAWDVRLDRYELLARILGGQLFAVAPDRVGDQEVTLARLEAHAARMRNVREAGAHVLLPLQRGERSTEAFYERAAAILGFPPVPAFPVAAHKGATPLQEVVRFVRSVRPGRIHLLGLGLKNRRTRPLLAYLAQTAPALRVSMDANLITATVGRAADGRASRPLTEAQDQVRAEIQETAWGAVHDAEGGAVADYTDSIGEPSTWLGVAARRRVADAAALGPEAAGRFVHDPDAFLQEPIDPEDPDDGPRWWEHPVLMLALDAAWWAYLDRFSAAARKTAAIRRAFAHHPAARQFAPPWGDDEPVMLPAA